MSGSVNKVILIGNLGADPDVKTSQTSGKKSALLSVATSETWRDKNTGERKQKTEWTRIVIFNEGLVKIAEQYLKKGAKVYVEGSLQTRKWQDQGGKDQYTTEVVLKDFGSTLTMLDSQRGERPPAPNEEDYGRESSSPPRRVAAGTAGRNDDMNDDIPF